MVAVEAKRQVGLVVDQADVVARLVLLDQVVLEEERLLLVGDEQGVEVGDPLAQEGQVEAAVVGGGEVAADAGAQALGLADVEDCAAVVLEEVDAGVVGEACELLGEIGGRRHGKSEKRMWNEECGMRNVE